MIAACDTGTPAMEVKSPVCIKYLFAYFMSLIKHTVEIFTTKLWAPFPSWSACVFEGQFDMNTKTLIQLAMLMF